MTPKEPSSLYETKPNGPNFLLIVILFGVAILALLIGAYFVVHSRGTKMIPHGPNPEPNSRLVLPAPAGMRSC